LGQQLRSCDVGSLPFSGDYAKFLAGAELYNSLSTLLRPQDPSVSEPCRYFEKKIIEGLLAKIEAGIDVPNYPQFRDMNEMFLQLIDGVRKTKNGYELVSKLSLHSESRGLQELEAINRNVSQIIDAAGRQVELKICVTGPYTLSSLFLNRTSEMFHQFSEVLGKIIEANALGHADVEVVLVAIDEPVFGLVSDTLLDHGSLGREVLLKAWETICYQARSKGAKTLIHLHSTADDLFWNVRHLDLIQPHVDDPLYESTAAKQMCDRFDKSLKASIAITDFDGLIRERIVASNPHFDDTSIGQSIADTWASIRNSKVDPTTYLETEKTMERRLRRIMKLFGEERVLFAGPECGMRSFPNLGCALECLRRVSRAKRAESQRVD